MLVISCFEQTPHSLLLPLSYYYGTPIPIPPLLHSLSSPRCIAPLFLSPHPWVY